MDPFPPVRVSPNHNRHTDKKIAAEVETELDRVSSARVYFCPFPSCYALLNRTALADAATGLRLSIHAESSSVRRTYPTALRQACRRSASSYFGSRRDVSSSAWAG